MRISTFGVVLAALMISTAAQSHAVLDHASPPVGTRVSASPPTVELWFSQELEPAFSTVKVVDKAGKRVDRGDKTFDSRDRSHATVSLPVLPAGRYRVIWRAVSVDTHVTEGDFTFDLAP